MSDGERAMDGFHDASPDTWREIRGRELALKVGGQIRKCGSRWSVPSATGAGGYLVDLVTESCTCPDHATRGGKCKHAHCVEFAIIWSQTTAPDGVVEVAVTARRKTYAQANWSAYNAAQVAEKEHAERLLDALCDGIPQPPQGPGRPRLPLRDVVFGVVSKVASTVSTRRAQSDLRACAAKGLVAKAPKYNTVIEHMASTELTPILTALIEESAAPLALVERNFAIDSTGFSTSVHKRWFDEKWGGGAGKERSTTTWVKCHAMTGTTTNVVTSAAVCNDGDAPMLPPLLTATARRFTIGDVTGDKAYASHANVAAVVAAGGAPFLMPKDNVREGRGPDLWRKMIAHFFAERTEFLRHYHARSRVESAFSAIKRKFGPNVRSKLPVAQANEILAKLVAHNLSCLVAAVHETGLRPSFWTATASAAAPAPAPALATPIDDLDDTIDGAAV
ncbi:MAG TPA: transposase [Kofleriaceae bacterium]|nr:transposase [Kofleriaceae bacterium]